MKKGKKILKWLGIIVATPIVLFLLLAILIYIPPIQNFAVHRVASSLSESMGMDIRVEKVRLAFPLDLAVHNVLAIEKGDTLLDMKRLRLNIALMPLFEGRADVDGFEIYGLKANTKSYISDTQIRGTVGELSASSHGVEWENEVVQLDRLTLRNADLDVALSDTAKEDTTTSTAKWNIAVAKADIEKSKIRLSMPGDTMRIYADIGSAALRGGAFDTGRSYYAVQSFTLKDAALNYDITTAPTVKGLDPNHIALTNVNFILDTLSYNKDGVLRAGLRGATLREKCGLAVNRISGGVYMDSTMLQVPALQMRTEHSRLDADIAFDFRSFDSGKGGRCSVLADAEIGYQDILTLAQGYVDDTYLRALPKKPVTLQATLTGNIDHLRLEKIALQMPGIVNMSAQGYATDILNERRKGKIGFNIRTQSLAVVRQLLPASVTSTVNIPDGMSANGTVDFNRNDYNVDAKVGAGSGTLATKAHLNLSSETYNATLQARNFPVATFVKDLPIAPLNATVRASGSGFDVLSPHATLTADAKATDFTYDKYQIGDLALQAQMRGGKATADFSANGKMIEANGNLEALLGNNGYDVALNAEAPFIDLFALGVTADTLEFGTNINMKASADKSFTTLAAEGSITGNHFTTPKISAMAKDILFDFSTSSDTTTANVSAGDLRLRFGTKGDIPRLTKQLGELTDEITRQTEKYEIDQEKLKRYLPVMNLYVDAGRNNPLYNIARMKGYSFTSAYLNLNTDPRQGVTGDARVGAFNMGAVLLDTIDTHILQDTTGIQLYGLVKNNRKNPNPLEVRLKSYLLKSGAGIELSYLDSDGEKGVDLGLRAELCDSGVQVRLYPEHPVLAYRNFTVNRDNFIYLGSDKSIRANVDLLADDGTGLQIYGEPKDSVNDLTVSFAQVNLGELSTVLPYLPQLTGMLNGDFHITDDHEKKQLSAMASIQATDLTYEGLALGNIGADVVYLPKIGGEHHASAFIDANGLEVLSCNGTYYDHDGGFFEGDAQLHDFPLQMLNGFMAGTDVALKGIAGGDLSVKGTFDEPVINGALDLDSAHIYSDVYGFDFRTDERELELQDSRLLFEDYNLYSTGEEPLVLNGTFDMSNFEQMRMDFRLKARNFELINTQKKKQSMVYGKVYSNFNGTVKGTVDNLSVRGNLEVLERTDMTYILKDSPLTVEDRLSDLVEFADFSDSTATTQTKEIAESGFDLTLGISISDAAQFHCNLSEDGQSYVNIEGGGDMTLRMTSQGDMRMTGRFTANSGEMNYALPVIPLKTFQLEQGSYVEFTGDIMNPTLNITATESTKAVVTENDQQRSVLFNVGVKITKPLNDMGLEFTIEAPEDLNVQNELATMSAEQRNKAALTLMATGMYMTDESMMSGSGFQASNALNAFLQSEIQNIAGSALKTIDINLGVESGTTETGASTTDYSFQFSKRFWGNRFSINIGGKVSTGAEATNSAESFINNVSIEYRLDESATRYVKVFYDREAQDPLEGQLTKTGAGLVLRRKTDRLGELFIFKNKKAKEETLEK